MSILTTAPTLDDRRFQDLVDEAKRMVQRRCPDWTDHNVSDPGVTLIEAFAYMVDQLLYRLNRVPDHQYLRYLELMGVERLPPSAASVPVTFLLSAPQDEDLRIERGVEVATRRHRDSDPVVFATERDLNIVTTELRHVLTFGVDDGQPIDRSESLSRDDGFPVFSAVPQPGDALVLGLDRAAPSCAIRLSIEADGSGDGVDRRNPPLRWEALCDDGWRLLRVNDPKNVDETGVDDSTGGLNDSSEVILHLPHDHAEVDFFDVTAGWIRCVIDEHSPDRPPFTSTPHLFGVEATTVGGTVEVVHGMDVHNEIVGVSDGTPGQRFELSRAPVVRTSDPLVIDISDDRGWAEWTEVQSFAESGPDDCHWRLDAHEGVVAFGPAVRDEDGSIRHYGAVPPPDARIRIRSYRVGGGKHGNVARSAIVTLRSAVPFVAGVTNRHPARGGLDAETAANARERGPLVVGTRDRAVTLADYEYLTTRASGNVARAKALEVGEDGQPAAPGDGVGVKVLVVPTVGSFEDTGAFRFEQLVPGAALLEEIQGYLNTRRMVGARIMVGPSLYSGVSITAEVHAKPNADAARIELAALRALYTYLSPLTGGPDGEGWPYGRPLNVGEIYGVLQGIEGVLYVEGARMFPVNPMSGEREQATDRLDLSPDSLIFGRGHSIRVVVDS